MESLTIIATKEEYNRVLLLKQPAAVREYEKILGQPRALQILSASFHNVPVQIIASTGRITSNKLGPKKHASF